MSKKKPSWKEYLRDLDCLYQMAIEKENISAALKIKEIQIQTHQREMELIEKLDPAILSEEQLDQLIFVLEKKSKEVEVRSP